MGDLDGGELWRLTLEHSPVGMALVAPDGRFLTANAALCTMLGHDETTLLSLTFQELTHPDDLALDLELLHDTLAGRRDSYRMRKRYRHADGRVVWGDLSVALLRRPDGSPIHFISQIIDVSELERERETLEAIFETVNVGLLLIGRDGTYERMNRRHAETMSLPFPDGHGGSAGQLGHVFFPDGRTLMRREDMPSYRAMQGEEFDDLQYWVGDDPVRRRAFSTSARNVRDASGAVTGAALAYQDITALMSALQVKDEFVASVSHELRTPLTAVLGYLELLCDREDLPAAVSSQLRVVERSALRLRSLVTDLLDVAKAGDGVLDLRREPMDVPALVRDSVEAARPVAAGSHVALTVESPETLTASVDGQRIRQVVDNLLSNALKYSEAGDSVTVHVEADEGDVRLAVTDTGIGIGAADLEQLFTRFFRSGEAYHRHIPGTGLGLHIVRAIVEAHGGTIEIASELGVGTRVTVRLPRDPAAAPP